MRVKRVIREVSGLASLNQAAAAAKKVIAESLKAMERAAIPK
jgi:hypothetical protein